MTRGLLRLLAIAVVVACTPAPEPPGDPVAAPAPAAPGPARSTNGALPEGAATADPVPSGAAAAAPVVAGFEPARAAPARGTPTEARGKATAYWGRNGPNLTAASPWRSLAGDGIHDRTTQALGTLQEPRTAFRDLPRANSGNFVDWVAALASGKIRPRGSPEVLDLDVLRTDTGAMPYVIFPHKAHTEWLSCSNCHDRLFRKAAGTTEIAMRDIARGRSCGTCHGRVAFPPTECFRCHSGPRPK